MEDLSPSKEKIQLLLNREHLPSISSISKENGGKNNRVFSVKLDNEQQIIAKFYFYSDVDKRDRFSREVDFLTFANTIGIGCVSKIIAFDQEERLCLYTKLSGRKLRSTEIHEGHIDQAANFIINLNLNRGSLDQFQKASDACMTFNDHIDLVSRRINLLKELQISDKLNTTVSKFLNEELLPKWNYELNYYHKKISKLKSDRMVDIDSSSIILSPSDFGFHNILMSEEKLFFLDFEYSGIDDCVKLTCDFLLSPDIEIPAHLHSRFIKKIKNGLNLSDLFIESISILKEIHRMKWVCILLNEFTSTGNDRRVFSSTDYAEDRLMLQLKRASKMLKVSGVNT